MLENIRWLGHASFKITGDVVIYIDPWRLSKAEKKDADLILITHSHYDHCSEEDVRIIQKDDVAIVTTADSAQKFHQKCEIVRPGDRVSVKGVDIEAVPAYNLKKSFHPKANGWVGFIISVGGKRIYHAGDTDLIPEMDGITADIALFPIGGTYTMDAKDAAEAANKINPEVAIPMHYGSIVGSANDAQRFKELCKCKVEILGGGM